MQKQVNEVRGLGPILGPLSFVYEERKLSDWFTHIIPAEKLLEDAKRQRERIKNKNQRDRRSAITRESNTLCKNELVIKNTV